MDESLFVRLSSTTPDAIMPLQLQYRMCGPINELANKLTYAGKLQCGSDIIERATLSASLENEVPRPFGNQSWLLSVIRPNLLQAVVFMDTKLLNVSIRSSVIDQCSKSPFNKCEGAITSMVVKALHVCGVSLNSIGVIAPNQSQVKYLKHVINDELSNVEINTVDQYQGRDKDVVLYSCTRSESNESEDPSRMENLGSNTILHDLRRLTVAVTRAKYKLVIIGDSQTLTKFPPFSKLLSSLEPHQLYEVCEGKDGFYSKNLVETSR